MRTGAVATSSSSVAWRLLNSSRNRSASSPRWLAYVRRNPFAYARPGSASNCSSSSAWRYRERMCVARSTSARSSCWRSRASRRLLPISNNVTLRRPRTQCAAPRPRRPRARSRRAPGGSALPAAPFSLDDAPSARSAAADDWNEECRAAPARPAPSRRRAARGADARARPRARCANTLGAPLSGISPTQRWPGSGGEPSR